MEKAGSRTRAISRGVGGTHHHTQQIVLELHFGRAAKELSIFSASEIILSTNAIISIVATNLVLATNVPFVPQNGIVDHGALPRSGTNWARMHPNPVTRYRPPMIELPPAPTKATK